MTRILEIEELIVLGYFLAVNAFYVLLLGSAAVELAHNARMSRLEQRWRVLGSPFAPRISVLAPAYGEEATIADSTHALLALNYPSLEVIVVVDGSPDRTLDVLIETFELEPIHPLVRLRLQSEAMRGLYRSSRFPNLIVADKENGGKADALNAAINISSGELVCAIDADTIIESDALQRMVRPFLLDRDVVASGGTIRVANGSQIVKGQVARARAPSRPLAGFQAVEYLRAFLVGRVGWNRLGGNLIISGAFGLFHAASVVEAGGYLHETVGEDMELVARLRARGRERRTRHRISFVPDPVAWTEVPEHLRALGRQRDRWHRGLADTLWRHRRTMLNPRYGALGLVVMPYFLFVELLAPVVEALGFVTLVIAIPLGALNPRFALLFFAVAYGVGTGLSLVTFMLEELTFHRYDSRGDRLRMIGWALLESLGYRQLTVVWRLRGLWGWMRGRKEWGAMTRRGFAADSVPPDVRAGTD